MIRALLVVIALALVVGVGARLVDREPSQVSEQSLDTPNDSDYYLLDAVVRQMNAQGKPEYRLTASESLHYPDESARLTDIHVDYFGQPPHDWDLNAGRGRIPPGEKNILLHDGVEVFRSSNGQQNMRLLTDRAWVRPEQDRIDTDVGVRVTAPGYQASGIGMQVFLKQDRLVLENDVQVTYEPDAANGNF